MPSPAGTAIPGGRSASLPARLVITASRRPRSVNTTTRSSSGLGLSGDELAALRRDRVIGERVAGA